MHDQYEYAPTIKAILIYIYNSNLVFKMELIQTK